MVRSQSILRTHHTKKRDGGVAQCVALSSSPSTAKKYPQNLENACVKVQEMDGPVLTHGEVVSSWGGVGGIVDADGCIRTPASHRAHPGF
jgi:hypothetical protein